LLEIRAVCDYHPTMTMMAEPGDFLLHSEFKSVKNEREIDRQRRRVASEAIGFMGSHGQDSRNDELHSAHAQRGLLTTSLLRNGLPAMIGAFAAAATAGIAALPALGLSIIAGLGFTWLSNHNQPS
jgi:hypothetical protein